MTASNNGRPAAPDMSPFFRPSEHVPQISQQTVSTPRGKHRRVLNVADTTVDEAKSSILGCTANMCTCIVGSGIVGLPFAINEAGFVAGVLLICLTAALTEKSLRLLIETAKHLQKQTYETTAEVAFGVLGFRFVLVNMFIMAFGAMVTYLMITKDCASLLLGVRDPTLQQGVLVVVSLCIQFPLACLRDMANLEKTSTLAVLIDCVIVGLVAYSSPWQEGVEDFGGWWKAIQYDTVRVDTIFVGLGVLSFAFECQESVFLIAGSLDRPTANRWGTVTKLTLAACLTLAMVCGVTGYFGFQESTTGNILNNLPPTHATTVVAQALLGVTMLATYPLASFVARHVAIVLCFEGRRAHEGYDSAILSRTDRRVLLTLFLYIMALVPATVFSDMGVVLALAGVVGASCLAYIGPGMLFLAVHGGRFLELTDAWFFTTVENSYGSNSHNISGLPLSETTPLTTTNNSGQNSEKKLNGIFATVVWYLFGFPMWCSIAEGGKQRILDHAQKLAAQPHVDHLRIGDIDLRGMQNLIHAVPRESASEDSHDPHSRLPREQVLSDRATVTNEHGDVLLKPMNAFTKNLEATKKIQHKAATPQITLEPDPQEAPPRWYEFLIAMFYVLFGCVAVVAGLYSLMVQGEDEDDDDDELLPVAPIGT